jgi:hypothetical protein
MDNHLHDIDLISKVIRLEFSKLIPKYNFSLQQVITKKADSAIVQIFKGDFELSSFISTRDGYELYFRKSNWNLGSFRSFVSFLDLWNPNLTKQNEFLSIIKSDLDNHILYSFDWYQIQIHRDLTFIEEFFPAVFQDGDLNMFDNSRYNG